MSIVVMRSPAGRRLKPAVEQREPLGEVTSQGHVISS